MKEAGAKNQKRKDRTGLRGVTRSRETSKEEGRKECKAERSRVEEKRIREERKGQRAWPVGPPNIPTVPARGEASARILSRGTVLRYASNIKIEEGATNEPRR